MRAIASSTVGQVPGRGRRWRHRSRAHQGVRSHRSWRPWSNGTPAGDRAEVPFRVNLRSPGRSRRCRWSRTLPTTTTFTCHYRGRMCPGPERCRARSNCPRCRCTSGRVHGNLPPSATLRRSSDRSCRSCRCGRCPGRLVDRERQLVALLPRRRGVGVRRVHHVARPTDQRSAAADGSELALSEAFHRSSSTSTARLCQRLTAYSCASSR